MSLPKRIQVNAKASPWSEYVQDLWGMVLKVDGMPEGVVTFANFWTPRPAVDEYDRGSTDAGFTFFVARDVWTIIASKPFHPTPPTEAQAREWFDAHVRVDTKGATR